MKRERGNIEEPGQRLHGANVVPQRGLTSRCAVKAFGVFYALETGPFHAPEQEQSGAEAFLHDAEVRPQQTAAAERQWVCRLGFESWVAKRCICGNRRARE